MYFHQLSFLYYLIFEDRKVSVSSYFTEQREQKTRNENGLSLHASSNDSYIWYSS